MMKFRKKPVVIEAMQFTGSFSNYDEIVEWSGVRFPANSDEAYGVVELFVETLEGEMKANQADWIIKGVKGEFYPCKPDIFDATYEYVMEGE